MALKFRLALLILVIGLLSACGAAPVRDNSALLDARPRSILVLPSRNDSIEVNAPYTFLSTISRPLAEKGYYVFPVAVVDLFLKENGLATPEEMNDVPIQKLADYFKADAILYSHIQNWGQKYQILSSKTVVTAKLWLVDTHAETTIWSGYLNQQQSNDNSQSGIVGMLVGAVVDQVIGSISDSTYELSRQGNSRLITGSSQGLIDGPYRERKNK